MPLICPNRPALTPLRHSDSACPLTPRLLQSIDAPQLLFWGIPERAAGGPGRNLVEVVDIEETLAEHSHMNPSSGHYCPLTDPYNSPSSSGLRFLRLLLQPSHFIDISCFKNIIQVSYL